MTKNEILEKAKELKRMYDESQDITELYEFGDRCADFLDEIILSLG